MRKGIQLLTTIIFSFTVLISTPNCFAASEAGNQQAHQALRALKTKAAEALSKKDFSALSSVLSKNFTVITVDNQKFDSLDGFKQYWEGIFNNPKMKIDKIELAPQADELTQFITPNAGFVDGVSNDTYHFSDGDVRTMETRWSALVVKESGQWKIQSIHFSANLLDNPVLNAAKSSMWKCALAAALVGMLIGAALIYFMKSKCKS